MPISHDQKADIGSRYLEAIKDRIKTRTDVQKRCASEAKALDDGTAGLCQFAGPITKKYKLTDAIDSVKMEHVYRGDYVLRIEFKNGISIKVPKQYVDGLTAALKACDNARNKSQELCREIEFLHDALMPTRLTSFQAYAGRLWSPQVKGSMIPNATLSALIEDFLTAARPAVCKVA